MRKRKLSLPGIEGKNRGESKEGEWSEEREKSTVPEREKELMRKKLERVLTNRGRVLGKFCWGKSFTMGTSSIQ
jgi:hypothetical protein